MIDAVGLFAGIGGIEKGFAKVGITTQLLCENDPLAQTVLRAHFPDSLLTGDIRLLRALPKADVVAAGFPCQNLSLAGNNHGIAGAQSGLINEVFRLLRKARPAPRWLVLENVPFMLWQKKGEAIRYITDALTELHYRWAYRVVDARAFGLPQRRRRVLLVASKVEDPRTVLFREESSDIAINDDGFVPCGFSWTEGRGGLGWAINGVPTLKGGSALGIPSPPAIWFRQSDSLATPDIRDAERLQGFPAGWTDVTTADQRTRPSLRWKLVGNAVSVPVAKWLANSLLNPLPLDEPLKPTRWTRDVWPNAAWGGKTAVHPVTISEWPIRRPYVGIGDFLQYPLKALSARATAGFLQRARAGTLNFAEGFLESVEVHLARMSSEAGQESVATERHSGRRRQIDAEPLCYA